MKPSPSADVSLPVGSVTAPPAAKMLPRDRGSRRTSRRSANSTSPRPLTPRPDGVVLLEVDRDRDLVLAARSDAVLVDELVGDRLRARVVTPVVQTVSFSGNAFSVKNARGKFRSPRGHGGSSQKRPEVPD